MKTVPTPRNLEFAWVTLALVLCVSGCGKSGGKADTKADAQAVAAVNAKLEAIRQAGQPVTPAELNAWYPEPPAGENAAPLYAEAFAALVVEEANSPSFLAKNQKALTLLHKAAAKSQCCYPMDLTEGYNLKLPHLAKIKSCAQLLGKEAVSNAGKGRMDLAAQSVIDGLRLGRTLEQEPLLISQLVRMASDSITQSSLEEALNIKAFTEEQLARLQAAFREEEGIVATCLARALTGERCSVIALFQMSPQEYAKLSGNAGTNNPFGQPVEFERFRKSASFNADFNFCLDSFSNWIAISSAPFPGCLDAASQWSSQLSEAKSKGYLISTVMLPALSGEMEKAAESVGRLRVAQTALAVERYRLAQGNALPDSLNQLAPKYLATVPDDPFDGKPLRYKKPSPKGYVIYSIGRNRQDDGGTPRPTGGKMDGPFDLTFAVRR